MTRADYFAPYRFVTELGERVRYDPSGADVLIADYDVLTKKESDAAGLVTLRLARGHIATRLDRAQSDYDMAAKKRSGKPWTEEQYREAGIELLHLRLKPDDHEPLDELCELWGMKRGEAVKRAIAEAHARHVAPYARRGALETPEGESHVRPLNARLGASKTDKSEGE